MLQLLGWIITGVVSLFVARKLIDWDAILIALRGKKLAVLGARGVGKTHIIKFLTSGSIPAEYKQTVAPEKSAARRFQLRELDLRIKETLDVSGDKAAYAEWRDLQRGSDVVFYLLRADQLIDGDKKVEERVLEDLRHIGEWLKASSPRPQLFIIGTHCDLDREFAKLAAGRMGDYMDKFRNLPTVSKLVAHGGGAQAVKVVLGSMKTIRATEDLVYQIFMQIKQVQP